MYCENNSLMYKKSLIFSVKLSNSISSKGWSITRDSVLPLIPELPYETECDIIVDEIHAKARFNIGPRIFFKSSQKELIDYLNNLIEEGNKERIEIEMLLNKENNGEILDIKSENYIDALLNEINDLKNENNELKSIISIYQNELKKIEEVSSKLSNLI